MAIKPSWTGTEGTVSEMPTDDERRRAAVNFLRMCSDEGLYSEFGEWCDACGPGRLADLIEPEPERTCRMIDNGVELCCSECDCRHSYDDEPKFCMGCGARVVDE